MIACFSHLYSKCDSLCIVDAILQIYSENYPFTCFLYYKLHSRGHTTKVGNLSFISQRYNNFLYHVSAPLENFKVFVRNSELIMAFGSTESALNRSKSGELNLSEEAKY